MKQGPRCGLLRKNPEVKKSCENVPLIICKFISGTGYVKRLQQILLLRTVFELFKDACSRALQCGGELCFDETLYANRGRNFSFKQYLPQKPSRYGFLFKSLGDSSHAYIYRLGCSDLHCPSCLKKSLFIYDPLFFFEFSRSFSSNKSFYLIFGTC